MCWFNCDRLLKIKDTHITDHFLCGFVAHDSEAFTMKSWGFAEGIGTALGWHEAFRLFAHCTVSRSMSK